MQIRSICASTAIFAGLIMGTPAWAACLPLWGTVCRPATSPSADTTAATSDAKPKKPLNLRAVAHKGGKHSRSVRTAARQRQHAAKSTPHVRVAVRSRHAAARRFASSARHRTRAAAMHRLAARSMRGQAANAPSPALAPAIRQPPSGLSSAPDAATNGLARQGAEAAAKIPSQDELTELDMAADAPKAAPQTEASAIDQAAEAAKPAPANADPQKVASSNNPNAAEAPAPAAAPAPQQAAAPQQQAAPAPQQPAEESSWIRRILIGLGGVLTLASAVRLFAG